MRQGSVVGSAVLAELKWWRKTDFARYGRYTKMKYVSRITGKKNQHEEKKKLLNGCLLYEENLLIIKKTLISWNGRRTGKCFEDESFTGGKEIMISWLRNRHVGMLWGWRYFEWMIKQLLDSIMRWRITQIEVGVILITRSQHLPSICVIPPRTNEN